MTDGGSGDDVGPGPGGREEAVDLHVVDEFLEVAGRQRAHRSFTDDPVAWSLVERVVAAATWAPSAENRQPWEFVVVTDASQRHAVGEVMAAVWASVEGSGFVDHLERSLRDDVTAGATGGVASAPVLVVACVDRSRAALGDVGSSIWPAVQNLLLAATAAGLGSALTTLATLDRPALAAVLDLPDHVEPVGVIPLGWPARPLGPPRRDPLADHLHHDRWSR